ncbi:hypothetical protein K469DRAFT_688741 [Zopfia rhizophila CBS 207.26]|uniref:Uncharacterized protein n=1 Tax=Zopfia rhizophila CBS 207.26 TaxID=1314779 RepID=A0A6A6E0Q5_9PEZI|nr:hypothetical protein K469DRAFT_688741 [Zopfia rhizophila CBS 207.26]
MNRSSSAIEPRHLTIPDFSDADIWGESMDAIRSHFGPWGALLTFWQEIASSGNQKVLSPVDAKCDRTAYIEEHTNTSPRAQAPKQSYPMPLTKEELAMQGPCTTELEASKGPLNTEVTLEVTQGNHDTVSLAKDSREAPHLLVENALHSTSGSRASEADAFQHFDEEHIVEQQVPNSVTKDIREAPTKTNIREINDVETEEPQYIRPEISEPASGVPHPIQVHKTITKEQPTKDADTRDAGPKINRLLVAEGRLTEQQATKDAVGNTAREQVIPYKLEPGEDLSPLYNHKVEEINRESTELKKHSNHGREVCKGRRPRKRLRGIEGTLISKQSQNAKVTLLMYKLETVIIVSDDNNSNDKEIR